MALTKVKAGNIILTTPSASSNDVTPATTQYVTTAIDNLVDTAPSTLNTLNELAAALGDDVNFSTTVTNSIAAKAPLASPTFTGTLTLPGSTTGTRTIKDSYTSGALANQGFLRSSGGNYWGYGTYQDGSGNWKSAVSVALERSVFAIDEDTAYWSHAPSQTVSIGSDLTTQPTNKVVFDLENGRVGIGTDTPSSQFVVAASNGGKGIETQVTTHATNNQFILAYDRANSAYLNMELSALNFGIATNNGTNRFKILANGNVGIGTTSPNFMLHINKGTSSYAPTAGVNENVFGINTSYNAAGVQGVTLSRLDGNWIDGTSGADSAYGWVWNYENSVRGGLVYDHRGSERMQLFSSYGALAFITPNAADGNGVPTDSNMVERLTILPGGNVGIGTDAPAHPFHITKELAGYQAYFNNDNGSAQGIKVRIKSNDSGNFNMLELVSASTGSDVTAMVVRDDGKILVGDSSSHTSDLLQIETPASGGGHGIQIRRNDSNTDQGIGHILFGNNTATDLAKIAAGTDGNVDSGYLIFATQPTSGNLTDRMTIDSDGRVGIGVAPSRNVGHLVVNGNGSVPNAGITYYAGSHTTYRNVCSNSTTAGSHRYWHVKTNIHRTTDAVMFVAKFHGYAYGSSGYTIDVRLSGYNYTANGGSIVGSQVANIAGGSFSASTYYASDGNLVLVLDFVGGYYTGAIMDFETPSPAGYNFDFKVLGTGMSANSTGVY